VSRHPADSGTSGPKHKPLIGIVGGIASGKSTVAREFGKLGCAVIDADEIAHALLEDPSVRDEAVRLLGPCIVGPDGRIDRRTVGQLVFADRRKLAALNAIIHPRVLERTEGLIAQYERDDGVAAIVLDVPLLVDVGWGERCDRLLFVDCAWDRRIERAGRHGGLTEQDIKIRENFQISLDEKAKRADNTIDNNSELSTLVRQIKTIFSEITKK
jgi:dephospho-CoA kinase